MEKIFVFFPKCLDRFFSKMSRPIFFPKCLDRFFSKMSRPIFSKMSRPIFPKMSRPIFFSKMSRPIFFPKCLDRFFSKLSRTTFFPKCQDRFFFPKYLDRFFPKCLDRLWDLPSVLLTGYLQFFPLGRRGREFYHSVISGTEVKNEWSCTPTSPTCLHGVDKEKSSSFSLNS